MDAFLRRFCLLVATLVTPALSSECPDELVKIGLFAQGMEPEVYENIIVKLGTRNRLFTSWKQSPPFKFSDREMTVCIDNNSYFNLDIFPNENVVSVSVGDKTLDCIHAVDGRECFVNGWIDDAGTVQSLNDPRKKRQAPTTPANNREEL